MFLFQLPLFVICVTVVSGDVLTDSAKIAALKNHNDHRRVIAKGNDKNKDSANMPKASNMQKLVYNKDLEKKAQDWAAQCKFEHTPQTGDHYGQNLYMTSQNLPQEQAMTNAGDSWWQELPEKYGGTNVKFDMSIANQGVGHFTQMAWAQCRSMGCAVQKCNFGTYVVCNYDSGNMINDNIYNTGEPCSACPQGMECQDALCAVKCKKSKKRK
ncbi:unnamed protein product [Bursaphelenchus xylophilus]|uniref:(pine wood nematode) hypothetical protein n=1 Tax=Bursaphelenchus xylophilus TaxID=6326 RepID=A0A1I7S411_BURXY|nr:unnamed protein product [Bursaphelenchus xylophilus]CAG9116616.1 unnamed protein product [Bursaphelenchus xylophilus]